MFSPVPRAAGAFASSSFPSDISESDFVAQNGLFAPVTTRAALAETPLRPGNVYFGTGLVTPASVSVGVPFDALRMLLNAEIARRQVGGDRIYHEISDTHAVLTNPSITEAQARSMTESQSAQYRAAARALGLGDVYSCVPASSYGRDSAYLECVREVEARLGPGENRYVALQSAGNAWFAGRKQVTVKIGWVVEDKTGPAGGRDERWFNEAYNRLRLEPISFLYGFCGLTFDASRPRVSPYTKLEGEKRLDLEKGDISAATEMGAYIAACNNLKITRRLLLQKARLVDAFLECSGLAGSEEYWREGSENTGIGNYLASEKSAPARGTVINLPALARQTDIIRDFIGGFQCRP